MLFGLVAAVHVVYVSMDLVDVRREGHSITVSQHAVRVICST